MTSPVISSIALDLGTTSVKAGLLGQDGALKHIVARPSARISVRDGRYESDALAYAEIAEQVLGECIALAGGCKTFGLCSQRSSFLIWERSSGLPITPLISWQDNRGASSCDALRAHGKYIRSLTGLPLAPYYFAPKLRNLLQENPGWQGRLESGELLTGTLDTFLIWRWSGGALHITDASMAARTLLMDIRQQQWSRALCDLFGISLAILPKIMPTAGMHLQLGNGLILAASAGDQSAALFASVSENGGEALVNLGTGCFVVRYLPDGVDSFDGYLHTLVYQDSKQIAHFACEGTLNSIAVALSPYPAVDCRAGDLAADDIFCLAEPSGLGAPYFRSDIGIRYSKPVAALSPRSIASLLLEAVIFRVARILEDFHRDSAIERVYLSGGLSELACLQQGIAHCVPFDVFHLLQSESSLQGAALLAAGMAPASNRESVKIKKTPDATLLPEKYRRWKVWMDMQLAF